MYSTFRSAATLLILFTLLTGAAYPLALTGLTQVILPEQANGSVIYRDDKVVGSNLIGQSFASAVYFHPRPSAAGQNGYDAAASSGSNLGPLSVKLNERIAASLTAIKDENLAPVPADAVTTSSSGLDPHISLANALRQVERVAVARGVAASQIQRIVDRVAEQPLFGLFGEPQVNVLRINIALDAELGKKNG
ncbi:MAG: potassium-transporting ATPase subunit C [Hyphomicrobium sp.]|nr:MAG: potassium-transporting ATPase subunit C [Hyphomicrobium sp.]